MHYEHCWQRKKQDIQQPLFIWCVFAARVVFALVLIHSSTILTASDV